MNKHFNWLNAGIVIMIILLGIVALNSYVQRGIQGRLRTATDDVGDQYTFNKTMQYEPYYSTTSSVNGATRVESQAQTGKYEAIPRKLIRNATISLKVKDCAQANVRVTALVKKFKGTLINSQLSRPSRFNMSGTIVLKVIPNDLEGFLAELRELGDVQSEGVSGEDVTEQYVDLQARLTNYKVVRERMIKILDERAREVKDILEVERELARLGGEIESIEGRIKCMDRQVDLATITVSFYEDKVTVTNALDLGVKFKETSRIAVETFVNTFNGAIIALAFLLPVAIWIGIVSGIIFGVQKLFWKK